MNKQLTPRKLEILARFNELKWQRYWWNKPKEIYEGVHIAILR